MAISCQGEAVIASSEDGKHYTIKASEVIWDIAEAEEQDLGKETRYEGTAAHPQLGTLRWEVSEYPPGTLGPVRADVAPHTILNDFDVTFEPDYPFEDDDWSDYDVPDHPFSIYVDSYHLTKNLLAHHGSESGSSLLNRMVFAHQVTALEAYLGDTLINSTLRDPAAMERLMTLDTELSKEKFTLAQIASTPDLVTTRIRAHLRGIIYHNLERVNVLYSTAAGFKILPLSPDAPALMRAIALRHDCVHRNGFDKDGMELSIFTKKYVQDTADAIHTFVTAIEEKLDSLLPLPF